jgi:hypothetical protein
MARHGSEGTHLQVRASPALDLNTDIRAEALGMRGYSASSWCTHLTMCEGIPMTIADGCGDHVKADGDDSDDSLASLFQDSTYTKSSLDPECHERASGPNVKHMDRSTAGQSQGGSMASPCDCKQRSDALQIDASY